jgi:hypothetical protein
LGNLCYDHWFTSAIYTWQNPHSFWHDKPKDHWIRVVGVVTISLGYFYLNSAQNEVVSFYWASIYARTVGLICFSGLVLFKIAKPKMMFFGLIDAMGAGWTLITLIN